MKWNRLFASVKLREEKFLVKGIWIDAEEKITNSFPKYKLCIKQNKVGVKKNTNNKFLLKVFLFRIFE